MTSLDELSTLLRAQTLPTVTEFALQHAIAERLFVHGIVHEREVCLTRTDRIDFLTDEGIGVEVKVDGSLSEVTRQLHRYAQHTCVGALLLVTTRSKHQWMPTTLNDKPLHVLRLIGGAF